LYTQYTGLILALSISDFPVRSFKEVYKNVYCFICNHKEDEKVPSSCFKSVYDRFTTEFVEIMDLQTDFSPLTEAASSEMCGDNEVFDDIFVGFSLIVSYFAIVSYIERCVLFKLINNLFHITWYLMRKCACIYFLLYLSSINHELYLVSLSYSVTEISN
jgi:hypothetical protein